MDDLNFNSNINGNKTNEPSSGSESAPETFSNGYTVTPDGGFYTKPKEDIIQDEVFTREPPKAEPQQQNPQQSNTANQQNFNNSGFNSAPQHNPTSFTPPYGYKPPKVKKPREKKRYGAGIVAIALILATIMGAISGAVVVFMTSGDSESSVTIEQPGVSSGNVNINIDKTAESVVEAVAEKVTPSVVGIRTTTSVMSFFGGTSQATGDGSGVVYSSDGYIITNYHVIAEAIANTAASKIEVFLDNATSKSFPATVVGYNISSDLAVIKINAKGLKAVEITDSKDLKVGQYVITIGNPGGLEFMDSVTYGVISGLNRVVSSDSGVELIQTDAAINPGNSGGALVNTKGELVGINSSKIVSEEYEGMGFAIPSNTVVEICKKIIEKENSPEPYIGISISAKYTPEVLKYYNFPTGAVVLSVADGSPAAKAGIVRGDIITEFDGKEIKDYTILEDLMTDSTPGDTVTIKLYRSGRYYSTNISIGYNNAVE